MTVRLDSRQVERPTRQAERPILPPDSAQSKKLTHASEEMTLGKFLPSFLKRFVKIWLLEQYTVVSL
jgi:hypothetical protein